MRWIGTDPARGSSKVGAQMSSEEGKKSGESIAPPPGERPVSRKMKVDDQPESALVPPTDRVRPMQHTIPEFPPAPLLPRQPPPSLIPPTDSIRPPYATITDFPPQSRPPYGTI